MGAATLGSFWIVAALFAAACAGAAVKWKDRRALYVGAAVGFGLLAVYLIQSE